jgi:hypothetical protein
MAEQCSDACKKEEMAAVQPLLYAAVRCSLRGRRRTEKERKRREAVMEGSCGRARAQGTTIASLPDAAARRDAHQRHARHITNTPLPP